MIDPLPQGLYLPTLAEYQRLSQTLSRLDQRTATLMTTFDSFEQDFAALETGLGNLATLVQQNNTATDELIALVQNLRTNLSPEEQARFDALQSRVRQSSSVLAGTATALQAQVQQTTAANNPTPPAPGPASAPEQPPQPGANPANV